MKITMITDLYPVKDEEKYTPRTLLNFVEGWKNLGHEVSVIKPNFILNSFVRKKPYYKNGNYGNIINLNFFLPFIGKIPQKINIENDCLYIAHMPSGILFADWIKVPFVAGIHQSDIDVLTKPIYKFYFGKRLLKALKNSKAIACRSHVLKKKLLKLYPEFEEKTFVCPSGVNKDFIEQGEIARENYKEASTVKILTAANLKKRKNIDLLIKAINELEGFELNIIGDGSERKKLEKIADETKIKFLGTKKHDEVLAEMRKSDIFVLASVNETFGMVYLESMASGCITVGTIDDGVDGIIKNEENGYLIKPTEQDIKNILLKIKNTDKNTLKTLQDNSFQTIRNYTEQKCCEEYLQQILRFCKDLTH